MSGRFEMAVWSGGECIYVLTSEGVLFNISGFSEERKYCFHIWDVAKKIYICVNNIYIFHNILHDGSAL